MDFIDPHKKRANKIRLIVGYVLVGLAILMTTLVIVYQAKGYGFGKNGQIIQNGLVFFSSNPSPAQIYLNGVLDKSQTNARLNLPAGEYTVRLTRAGYKPWQRAVGVEGGSVEHFDYPFLVPQNLVTTSVQSYTSQPALVLHSPDRHWLLVQQPGNDVSFTEYDLTNPKAMKPTTVTIPTTVASVNATGSTWQLVAWSTDNRHVLLDHVTGTTNDYVVLDRQTPAQSVDLTKTLSLNNTTLPAFDNNHYNQYFLFDKTAGTLTSATLSAPQPTPVLDHVLTYKAYGSNIFLYTTADQAPAGEVLVKLQQRSNIYTLHALQAGASTYLLDVTQYSGAWYVVEGDSSEDKTYVYKNPQAALGSQPVKPLVPVAILKVTDPNYVSFSASAQFVVAENGQHFSVYDAENDKMYTYAAAALPDAGQHATWMDGDRLIYVSNGKVVFFDYDNANPQTLQPAVSGALDYFSQNYKWSYTIAPNTTSTAATQPFELTQTSLLTPTDQ